VAKMVQKAQKIDPFLWFDDNAEEAATFYVSLFEDSEITNIARYPENTPGQAGSVMTVNFTLAGQPFIALNGGPSLKFSAATSFFVHCEDQDEVDRLWDALTDGGETQNCGWVTDRFGVTWQIIPDRLMELIGDPDPGRSSRAMQAMLQMVKIEIKPLEDAANATGG
jgi:predicted 3-demethylubiquinone-9 3-methyltransferase (glyoxalase superfamily)